MPHVVITIEGDKVGVDYDSEFVPHLVAKSVPQGALKIIYGKAAYELIQPFDNEVQSLGLFKTEDQVVFLDERLNDLGLTGTAFRRTREILRKEYQVAGMGSRRSRENTWAWVAKRTRYFQELSFKDAERSALMKKVISNIRRTSRYAELIDEDFRSALYAGVESQGWKAISSYGTRVMDLFLLDAWRTVGAPGCLIMYCNSYDEDVFSDELGALGAEPRDYVPRAEIDEQLTQITSASKTELNRIFKMWSSISQVMWGEMYERDQLTIDDAEGYVKSVIAYKRGLSEIDQIIEEIPAQTSAPLVFREEVCGEIDIDDVSEQPIPRAQTAGGARAISHILADFRQQSRVDNVIPTFRRKADRITQILKVFESEDIDDGYVVELGLEISSLGILLESNENVLGKDEVAEFSMFVEPAAAYLDQFPVWRSYQDSLGTQASALGAGAEVGRDLLAGVLKSEGIISGRARLRVEAYIAEVDPEKSSAGEREGVARTGQNLTAAMTRSALSILGKEIDGAAADAVHAGRAVAQNAIGESLKENAPTILRFANARNLFWLARLVGLITGGHDQT